MGSPTFQFKQFAIAHDRCAMKVGTDGVLVGAWAELPEDGKILDVGTGSGLIALMVAQRRPTAQVVGIDIDAAAVEQARENVEASPFGSRIDIRLQSLQELAEGNECFDAIVCNPPFFEETLLPPDTRRCSARHSVSLPFEEMIAGCAKLLREEGSFTTILPTTAFDSFRLQCFAAGLPIRRSQPVQGNARKPQKRVLATFVKKNVKGNGMTISWTQEKPLILNDANGRTHDYAALTNEFYLW